MIIKLRPWEAKHPVWLVWCPENGESIDDAREIEAADAEQAAEDYAEHDDQGGDYTFVGGREAVVHVRAKGSLVECPDCRGASQFRETGDISGACARCDNEGEVMSDEPVLKFKVSGEAVPQYHARETT